MDVSGYLEEVKHRAENIRRLRAVLYFGAVLSTVSALTLSLYYFVYPFLWLIGGGVVVAIGVATIVARNFYVASELRISDLALQLDAALKTRGRVVSFSELILQGRDQQSILEVIEEQLRTIEVDQTPAQIVPYQFERKDWIALILTLLMASILAFLSARAFVLTPEVNPIVESLREKAQDGNLPAEVQGFLKAIADEIESPSSSQELETLISQAEKAIDSAKQTAASQSSSSAESELPQRPDPSVTQSQPLSSPTPIDPEQRSPEPQDQKTEGEKSDEKDSQEKGEQGNSGNSKEQETSENSEKEEGDEQGAGGSSTKKEDQQGEGKGNHPSDEKKEKGAGESGSQGQDQKQSQSDADKSEKNEGADGNGEAKPDSSESGAGKPDATSEALDQAEQLVEQVKQDQGKEAQGETPKGEGQDKPDPSSDAEAEVQQPAGKPPGDTQGDTEGAERSGNSQQQKSSPPQSPERSQQGEGDAGEKGDVPPEEQKLDRAKDTAPGGPQENSQSENKTDSPANKSSLPERQGETQEFKDGDGKQWDGPQGKVDFKDQRIDYGNEAFDTRYTGATVGSSQGDSTAPTLSTIVPRPLGRPDSITDSSKQPVPLEYRDVID